MTLSDDITGLERDSFRDRENFSTSVDRANTILLSNRHSDDSRAAALKSWLHENQPCLFGRIATGPADLAHFCMLTEDDVGQGDDAVRDKILAHRRYWRRQALAGKKSAFIIHLASEDVAFARPDAQLLRVASRLTELYLREEIQPDAVYLDKIHLDTEATDDDDDLIEWSVGVNFFGAQGDGRWWADHRIPGGIALSMNSVGHMVRSAAIHGKLRDRVAEAEALVSAKAPHKVDTLGAALKFAMMTIANAQDTTSGHATELNRANGEGPAAPVPPFDLSRAPTLRGFDFRKYSGWYHTDHTLPRIYFREDVERPADATRFGDLDFTYLHDANVENPAFETMGRGVRLP